MTYTIYIGIGWNLKPRIDVNLNKETDNAGGQENYPCSRAQK